MQVINVHATTEGLFELFDKSFELRFFRFRVGVVRLLRRKDTIKPFVERLRSCRRLKFRIKSVDGDLDRVDSDIMNSRNLDLNDDRDRGQVVFEQQGQTRKRFSVRSTLARECFHGYRHIIGIR